VKFCNLIMNKHYVILMCLLTIQNFIDSLQDGGDFRPKYSKMVRCANNLDQTLWISSCYFIWIDVLQATGDAGIFVLGKVKETVIFVYTIFCVETIFNFWDSVNLKFGGVMWSSLLAVITIIPRNYTTATCMCIIIFILIDKNGVIKALLDICEYDDKDDEHKYLAMMEFKLSFTRGYWYKIEAITLLSTALSVVMIIGFAMSIVTDEDGFREPSTTFFYFLFRTLAPLLINLLMWFKLLSLAEKMKAFFDQMKKTKINKFDWVKLKSIENTIEGQFFTIKLLKFSLVVQLLAGVGVSVLGVLNHR
jgi:hypothetical protein